jgi:general stress protein 26
MPDKTASEFWDDISGFDTCMFATMDGNRIRSRPMAPYFSETDHTIRFLASRRGHKVDEINTHPDSNVIFAESGEWMSVSGKTSVTTDAAIIDELWTDEAAAWLDRGDAIALIVKAEIAEYWNAEGTLSASWDAIKSAFTNEKASAGEHQKLAF